MDAKCPVCGLDEDWLHVAKCNSTNSDKEQLIKYVETVEHRTSEQRKVEQTAGVLQEFFFTNEYDKDTVKRIFRGWIIKDRQLKLC